MADIYTASDEEIAHMSEPPVEETDKEDSTKPEAVEDTTTAAEPAEPNEPTEESSEEPSEEPAKEPTEEPKESDTENSDSEKVDNSKDFDITKPKEESNNQEIDYKDFYDKVMAPIKANGHTIQLKNQEEVIKLIQQGANYTKKMQELAPYRKAALMLKDNDLLDEDKLSFLIDLQKGDSAAVSKFLKDKNIDPLDIDTELANNYKAGTHKISNEYIKFKDAFDALSSTEEGQATVRIFDTFDEPSQRKLIEQPELMQMLHEQVQAGFYKTVCDEVARQKMLGNIPASMSFLEAYEKVGVPLLQSQLAERQTKPIASQARITPSSYTNSKQAKSANPTRISNSKTTTTSAPNYLAMSDEEFEKQFGNIRY